MRERLSRRQALARIGAAGLGAVLGEMSAVQRLAQAVAGEMDREVGPLAVSGCAIDPVVYGCLQGYNCSPSHNCEGYTHDCLTKFSCIGSGTVTVYCQGKDPGLGNDFICENPGAAGNDPYGCTDRIFECNTEGVGHFYCGDGARDQDVDFNCRRLLFHCPNDELLDVFDCRPDAAYRVCG